MREFLRYHFGDDEGKYVLKWLLVFMGLVSIGLYFLPPERMNQYSQRLSDGRTVNCVVFRNQLSCDWEHAK